MNKTLTSDLREQLELIERCQPDLLLMHIGERTAFDVNLITKVFELAKERAAELLATQPPGTRDEPIAWEATTVAYTKYITNERYQKFSPEARKWYKPYRCSACSEPRDEVTDVQWWLAELDQYGNPKLSDGAHSERAGADKAMYLIKNLGLDNKGKRWAVARVELSEPRPSADGVNQDAVSACRAMVDAGRRTTPDREAIIEECAAYLDRKWDSAAELLRALKTAPNGEKG